MQSRRLQMLSQVLRFASKKYFYLGVLILINVVARLNRLSDPITGYYEHRATQTAFGIRSLAETTLNPLAAEMPALGPPWKLPFEFPLYQLAAALLVRAQLFSVDQAGRIISVLSFILLAYLVFAIASAAHGQLIGLLGAVIVLFSSYGLFIGSEVLIDGLAVALSLWAYLIVYKWGRIRPELSSVALVCIAVILSALVKLNTTAIWVLGCAILITFNQTIKAKSKVVLTGLLGISLIPSLIWTSFADHIKNENRYTQWLVSSELNDWYFGSIRDRFEFASISNSLSHFTQATVGGTLCLVVLIFFALLDAKKRVFTFSLLTVLVSGPLIFVRLYNIHSYYWIAVLPAAVLLVCAGLSTISQILAKHFELRSVQVAAVFLTSCLIFSTYLSKSGSEYINLFLYRRPIPVSSYVITENTEPNDLIIVLGDDWNPATLYFSGRRGLTLRPGAPKLLASELRATYKYVYSWENDPAWGDYFPAGFKFVEVGEHLYRIVE